MAFPLMLLIPFIVGIAIVLGVLIALVVSAGRSAVAAGKGRTGWQARVALSMGIAGATFGLAFPVAQYFPDIDERWYAGVGPFLAGLSLFAVGLWWRDRSARKAVVSAPPISVPPSPQAQSHQATVVPKPQSEAVPPATVSVAPLVPKPPASRESAAVRKRARELGAIGGLLSGILAWGLVPMPRLFVGTMSPGIFSVVVGIVVAIGGGIAISAVLKRNEAWLARLGKDIKKS
ncbi:MAG: hypothetical protein ACI9OJ_002498 [Myxococcota bacterium]|jgi:hypothetical protein